MHFLTKFFYSAANSVISTRILLNCCLFFFFFLLVTLLFISNTTSSPNHLQAFCPFSFFLHFSLVRYYMIIFSQIHAPETWSSPSSYFKFFFRLSMQGKILTRNMGMIKSGTKAWSNKCQSSFLSDRWLLPFIAQIHYESE